MMLIKTACAVYTEIALSVIGHHTFKGTTSGVDHVGSLAIMSIISTLLDNMRENWTRSYNEVNKGV